MQLVIHRGTHEIGGNCVEIRDENTRLLFDLGLPLDENVSLEDLKSGTVNLFKEDDIAGIFITHSHPDHYGLLEYIDKTVPVYASKTTCNIIKNISELRHNYGFSDLNLKIADKKTDAGNFTVTPYCVDHSAPDALAFLIENGGRRILYTGDLRFHGRNAYASKNLAKITGVDYLIMEGSTIGRPDQNVITEEDVKNDLIKEFSSDELCMITLSSQNLARFISVFKACIKTRRTFVIDPYTCFVLENFKDLGKNIPQFDWNNIRVYFGQGGYTDALSETKKLYDYKDKKISIKEILSHPEKYVIKTAKTITDAILKQYDISKIRYIYSMWSGYLEKPSYTDPLKPQLRYIHTSGHAYVKDLQDFVAKLSPKIIIPIHTEAPEKYKSLYGSTVKVLNDGEIFNL